MWSSFSMNGHEPFCIHIGGLLMKCINEWMNGLQRHKNGETRSKNKARPGRREAKITITTQKYKDEIKESGKHSPKYTVLSHLGHFEDMLRCCGSSESDLFRRSEAASPVSVSCVRSKCPRSAYTSREHLLSRRLICIAPPPPRRPSSRVLHVV